MQRDNQQHLFRWCGEQRSATSPEDGLGRAKKRDLGGGAALTPI